MNERDLQLAQAMVAEYLETDKFNGCPPPRNNNINKIKNLDKLSTFSSVEEMASLWAGSDVDLTTLRKCRIADRLEYRLHCLNRKNAKNSVTLKLEEVDERESFEEDDDYFRRRRRSGTWPRTRSLNAPSPIQQFGPCGRIMKNSAMVMQHAIKDDRVLYNVANCISKYRADPLTTGSKNAAHHDGFIFK